jgi:hypothetical protein
MAKRRRNPPDARVPLVLIAGVVGFLLLRKTNQPGEPVQGFGKFLKKQARGVTKHSIIGKIVQKIAPKSVKKILRKIDPTAKRQAPAPAPTAEAAVEFQDENGNVITEAEYNRRVAEMNAANAAPPPAATGQVRQLPVPSGSSFIPAMPSNQELFRQAAAASSFSAPSPSAPSGGGFMLPPPQAMQVPQALSPSGPAEAPKKMSPILTIAAFAAVPIVLGLTGGK